jgi:hypothetical protein
MRKKINLLIAIFFIFIFMAACTSTELDEKGKKFNVSIERIDQSIRNDSGQIIANIYYDKPILSGDSEAIKSINSFFVKESESWLGGSNRLTHFQEDWLEGFLEDVNELREMMGDEVIAEQPFLYTIDTRITLLDEETLSIMQIATVQTAGPRSWYYYGSTFDLKTGELLPLNKLIKTNADSLRDIIVKFIEEKAILSSPETLEEFKRIYGKNNNHSYEVEYDQKKIQLNYEYFYDGKNVYIILNHGVLSDNGIIMKWDGQSGNEFQASLIGYILEKDESIGEIEY